MVYIPDSTRDPLRIAGLSKLWEPRRIPTPRFIDAWTSHDKDMASDLIPAILDSSCENVVVWRTTNMSESEKRELHVQDGEISFCRVFAKSGFGREYDNPEPHTNDNEDDNDDDI